MPITGASEKFPGEFWDNGGQYIHVKHPDYGATGDGATNDRAALVLADAAATSGKSILFGPGSYKVGSNLTIAAPPVFAPGAKIKPGSGVTVTFSSPVHDGLRQIFDTSAGGTIVLSKGPPHGVRPEWWGAVGDGAVDDLTPMRESLAAARGITDGGSRGGKWKLREGANYAVSNSLTAGDGTDNLGIIIEGGETFASSNSPLTQTKITQTSATADTLTLWSKAGVSNSVVVKGVQLVHTVGHTGRGLYLKGQSLGLKLENVIVYGAGTGITFDSTITPQDAHFAQVMVSTCTIGLLIPSDINLATFDSCYFQSCVTAGIQIGTASSGVNAIAGSLHFLNCVVQSNTGPGIQIFGRLINTHVSGGWWEFPGSDMIRLGDTGYFAGGGMWQVTFTGVRFDGSSGVGGRHVININVAGAGNAVRADGITYIGCEFANLNGGKVHNLVAANPSGSSDSGFGATTIIGCVGAGDLDGNFPAAAYPNASILIKSKDFTTAHVLGTNVPFQLHRADGVVNSNLRTTTASFALSYSASMTLDARRGNIVTINATNNTAFTINDPASPATDQLLTFVIKNTSGGALGVATWGASFKMTAWTQPATGFKRTVTFWYDGTNWIELSRAAADIPN